MTGTRDTELILINEAFEQLLVGPHELDYLLENGWRHFGTRFQRYSVNYYNDEIRRVIPLRVRLSDFRLSKSQRRVLRKNRDVRCEVVRSSVNREIHELFARHKRRFVRDVPESIHTFMSLAPAAYPTEGMTLRVMLGAQLVAASFFELSTHGLSSIYAMFDPIYAARGLGIFTMLTEIEHARENGKQFYYHGYAYEGESFYDYKKRLSGLEAFDWKGNWTPYSRL